MAIIKRDSGCRVGWVWYDNRPEAVEAAGKARAQADRMVQEGYDFGYVYPGGVEEVTLEGKPAFKVITP